MHTLTCLEKIGGIMSAAEKEGNNGKKLASIAIDKDWHKQLKIIAIQRDSSMREIIRQVVSNGIKSIS